MSFLVYDYWETALDKENKGNQVNAFVIIVVKPVQQVHRNRGAIMGRLLLKAVVIGIHVKMLD